MDIQLRRFRKAEHRLAKFWLRDGLGLDRDNEQYKRVANFNRDRLMMFDELHQVIPPTDFRLEFLHLPTAEHPTLKSLIRCDSSDRLIRELATLEHDDQLAYVLRWCWFRWPRGA